mmetsp:Transcript_30654/g.74284  ORF Transcript_30654/g.74284 Transcript_30654/m.74284 type:complete len:461 (-) Transcript_30654:116-1498(-)|eukprot:CAMPEP_0113467068 /NCGR_PEP_ID=MMETSP0014_2-20120614/14615_1 /TAXON_ID=2857 /ORGANISM="Nitzschia sp." /LENGTH=460 /DNA_ID=CAMNT_0000359347 /DNA_START=251 /DNA_END=1633 /DNA_ORIENTATION=- /assembly_acc=CAM_ASM_000159
MASPSVAYLHWYYHNNSSPAAAKGNGGDGETTPPGAPPPTTTCFCDSVSATGKNSKDKNKNSTTATATANSAVTTTTTTSCTEFPVGQNVKVKATPQTLAALFGVHMVHVITTPSEEGNNEHGGEQHSSYDDQINEWLIIREVLLDFDDTTSSDNGTEEPQVLLPLLKGWGGGDGGGGGGRPEFCWDLHPGKHYNVTVNPKYLPNYYNIPTPIHQIFRLLPGRNGDLKSDNLEKLSNTFYDLIWHSPTTPPEFSKLFVTKWATSGIQAFRQYDWFHELFGGPSMQSEDDQKNDCGKGKTVGCPHAADANATAGGGGGCPHDAHMMSSMPKEEEDKRDLERLVHLRKKMMIKHASSRMTCEYAITWLRLMNQAVDQVFPLLEENVEEGDDNDANCSTVEQRRQLRYSLNCYWLHFFALFPYTEKERQQFRDVVFGKTSNGKVEEQQEESSFFDPELVKQVD